MAADGRSVIAVARAAAVAALEVPDVLDLHGGEVGEIATYGGGARVKGVRVHDRPNHRIRLHLIVRFGARLDDLAEAVRARVGDALNTSAPDFAGATIDIHVADVRTGAEALPAGPPEEPVRWR